MKILQLAPLWEPVPPRAYGGIEYVLGVLVNELVRLGHDVTLAASGDSQTEAQHLSVYDRSLRTANVQDPYPYTYIHVAEALKEASKFDVVHNHGSELPMALQPLIHTPMLTTLHNLVTPDARPVWDSYGGYFNTPSQAALSGLETYPNFVGVIHHGIDVESFPFQEEKEDYLLFLSRMSPEKGPLEAIEAARRSGKRLIMAGKVDDKDFEYYWSTVAPLIDGQHVKYVGEANAHDKRELYRRASGLLFPIKWNEPFGLVLAESMACGTPVLTFRSGAAPEIIEDGLAGYVVDTVDEMAEAVLRLNRLDPRAIRAYVAERFSGRVMAERYVRAYHHILDLETTAKRDSVRYWRGLSRKAS